jgi:hypothetical protein
MAVGVHRILSINGNVKDGDQFIIRCASQTSASRRNRKCVSREGTSRQRSRIVSDRG